MYTSLEPRRHKVKAYFSPIANIDFLEGHEVSRYVYRYVQVPVGTGVDSLIIISGATTE